MELLTVLDNSLLRCVESVLLLTNDLFCSHFGDWGIACNVLLA